MDVYTVADGLLSGQFNYKSGYKDKENNIYFSTMEGMISFNNKNVRKKTQRFPYITEVLLFNRPVRVRDEDSPLKNSIIFLDQIILKHNQNTFSFRLATLNYEDSQA